MNSTPFNSTAHAISWLKRANLAGKIERYTAQRYPRITLTPPRTWINDQAALKTYRDAIVCLGSTYTFHVDYRG